MWPKATFKLLGSHESSRTYVILLNRTILTIEFLIRTISPSSEHKSFYDFVEIKYTSLEKIKENPLPDCSATPLHYITNQLVFLYPLAKYETCHSIQFWPRKPHKLIFVFISLVYSCWGLAFAFISPSLNSPFYPLLTLPVFPPTWKS